jgi:hypothetical protein
MKKSYGKARIFLTLSLGLVLFVGVGCSADSREENTDVDFTKLKSEACSLWVGKDSSVDRYMPYLAAKKFQQISEIDPQFTELSRAAFVLHSLNYSPTLADSVKPVLLTSVAEVTRYCSSNEFNPD